MTWQVLSGILLQRQHLVCAWILAVIIQSPHQSNCKDHSQNLGNPYGDSQKSKHLQLLSSSQECVHLFVTTLEQKEKKKKKENSAYLYCAQRSWNQKFWVPQTGQLLSNSDQLTQSGAIIYSTQRTVLSDSATYFISIKNLFLDITY